MGMVTGWRAPFRAGVREGLPVAVTFFLAFLGVGAVFRVAGLGPGQAGLSTLLLMSGPAQAALADMLRDGRPLAAMLLAVCVINGRYFVMSAVLAPHFRHVPLRRLLLPLTCLSTSTFAATYAAARRPGADPLAFLLGVSTPAVPAAVLGTVAGFHGAGLLPELLRATVEMILPLYFMTLLAREWPRALPLLAGLLGFVLTPLLQSVTPDLAMLLASGITGVGLGLAGKDAEGGHD